MSAETSPSDLSTADEEASAVGPRGRGTTDDTVTVASWTMVSRVTGLVRIIVIAAVLGPTYLGNAFQAINQMPNLTYQALTGSLLSMMLVPRLVPHVDRSNHDDLNRFAGGFLGMAIVGFTALTVAAVLAGPLLLRLFTIGVHNAGLAGAQRRAGWILLVTVMPQVILYSVAGTGEAVMNANGKFALAAAAPALENVGVIAVMVLYHVIYGSGSTVSSVRTPALLLLGLGSTAAVVLHASAQWWGAHRVGITLVPRFGWRDPQLRQMARDMVPSAGYTALNSARYFGMLVVANLVPGGVIAFQLALNFLALPVALAAWPVSVAMLPVLSRLHLADKRRRFREELVGGTAITFFLMIPAALAYLVLAVPLARAVAYGAMSSPQGIRLIEASLAALAIGMLGEAGSVVATHAAYARGDARSAFRSMVLRTVVSGVGMVAALLFTSGIAVVVTLGISVSVGNLLGTWYLARVLRADLPSGDARLGRPLLRAAVASALMIVPAYLLASYLPSVVALPGKHLASLLLASAVGLVAYLGFQKALGSEELASLRGGFGRMLLRSSP
ncbi:MAG TPA: lipid II flippase MurJ [Acidimicrobiales bacterium]|nr:lipid II flippase MurJ [Acidimicrobiales bacterium]